MDELLQLLTEWFLQYGEPILFIMLVLGIVGLPISDETLLMLCGWLMLKGKLLIGPTIMVDPYHHLTPDQAHNIYYMS